MITIPQPVVENQAALEKYGSRQARVRVSVPKSRERNADVSIAESAIIWHLFLAESDKDAIASDNIVYDIKWIVYRGVDAASAPKDSDRGDSATLFLDTLYGLRSEEDSAIDTVIARYEQWLETGDLLACDKTLAEANLSLLPPTVALAILSMTLVGKDQLPSRRTFFIRTRQKLIAKYGEEEANSNLIGLE